MNESQRVFSGKVLVVDDDFAVRIIACETLEQAGFEVKAVENGQEAISLLTSFNPDIILLDLLMPGMDGFQTCKEIRSKPCGSDVPIIILTGLDDLESITSAFRQGATDFVTKPIQWLVLPHRIQNLIQSSIVKSERRQAIESLQEREQRFDFLLTNSPAIIYTCKCNGDFGATFVSKNVCRILGYNENDFLSDSAFWADHIHPDDAAQVFSNLKLLTEHGSLSHEYRFCDKDGTYRWMRDECLMLHNTEGQLIEVIGFWLDISKHKQAEEKLDVSEQKYQSLFESMTDSFVLVDMEGRIVEFNNAFCSMLKYTAEEICDLIYEMITPENWLAFEKEIIEKQVMVRGYSDLYEKEYRCKDGSILPIELRTYLSRDHDGTPIGMWAIIRDISKRKQAEQERLTLEQQLQQAQKLESLGVLAGGIAHDFNNILQVIGGGCSLIKMDIATAESFIPQIEKAVDRAAGLCSQMLAYAGKATSSPALIVMWMLVDDVVRLLKASIGKNIVITTSYSPDLPTIKGDTSQLTQIVMNLLLNASDAIGQAPGEIRILLTKTEITGQSGKDHLGKIITPGKYLCLEISDNGCGMDEDTQRRIFEPFFTTKFTGRGLGMSAVLGIITAHKGALQLSSKPGKGTSIKVYLPAPAPDTTAVQPQEPVPTASEWRGNGTVLLVEDEKLVRDIARTLLEEIGFTVIEASDGKEALDQYQKNADISLVLTDIGMPVMDGYTLIRELKKLTPAVPVIVVSGFGKAEIASQIDLKDIAALISKPYTYKQLRDILKGVVEAYRPDGPLAPR